ncbi:MAG TPA: multicopper oxidase domain-containing protein [Thermoleophilia bacterium]|nr:multicopper oxidase domain-containing protein [Thermoleophilia bacterium]
MKNSNPFWMMLLAMAVSCVGWVMAGDALAVTERHYYIQAEDVVWDFAPTGLNLVHCLPGPSPCAIPQPWRHSHTYKKTRYIEYTDDSFNVKKSQPAWLGILGPIIRAEVDDTVIVHFRNMARSGAYGMHPHGFRYTKPNEGAHYFGVNAGTPPGAGARIPFGGSFDYEWVADADSSPGPGDPSSLVWWYHSHVDEPAETNAGLLGPIIITKLGMANTDGSPKDVNREFVTAFFIFNNRNGAEPGLMHSINGYIFGNLRGLVMDAGETVRWYVLGMGNEVDLHTAHWHGKTLQVGGTTTGRRTDVVELLPGSMVTATMIANNPGEWLFHCHVADHIDAGMMTTYQILPPP